MTPAEQERIRNARIRRLRAEREGIARRQPGRPFQPLVLLGWIGGVIALTVIVLYLAILALAPAIMAWVEERPTLIQNELIVDFVNWYRPESIADSPASSTYRRVSVEIPPGATDGFIGQLLVNRGLIHSELAFHHWVFEADRAGDLQAGQYDLSPTMPPSFIIGALRQEAGPEVTITILEGLRLEEVVAYLGTTDLTMDLDQFRELVTLPPPDLLAAYPFLAELPVGRTLEGYLYPDTYRVFANATARDVVDRLLSTFDQRLSQEIRDQVAARGLTIDFLVRLGSIVEREAVLDEERALIAGVYTRRLTTAGWNLDADPTLQYGLATAEFGALPMAEWGTVRWWKPLPAGGAEIVLPETLLPYQTYQVGGLPPTPISSPRIASIQAAAFPDMAAGYFFFVAACPNGVRDGSHRFAVTLAEHEANIAQMNAECP
ncbi:MAG: endolytic transglycosylase MltG [Candidatus Limnocylindria bacterium]